MIDILGLNSSIGTMLAAHNLKYSRSTQEKGMVRRSNPYSPPPWEQNKGISRMTDMFADGVPTLGEVAQASMMMTTPNPFAIRYGQQASNNSFGHVLMQVRAMNQQRDNQLSQLLMDQQQHEFMKQKFEYQQHKDAFDIIREQSQNMRDTVGEAYRELMGILPKLDNASANRLMQGIIDDPIPLESLESPSDVWRFISTKMADAGLNWRETKKGRASGADVTRKITRQSTVSGVIVLPDGRRTKVATRTYSDGSTETIDVLTGQQIPAEVMKNAQIEKTKSLEDSFAAAFNRALSADDGDDGVSEQPWGEEPGDEPADETPTASTDVPPWKQEQKPVAKKTSNEVTIDMPPWQPDKKQAEKPKKKKSIIPSKERRAEAAAKSTSAWDDMKEKVQAGWESLFK